LVGGDGIVFHPVATGVLIEILARVCVLVDRGGIEAWDLLWMLTGGGALRHQRGGRENDHHKVIEKSHRSSFGLLEQLVCLEHCIGGPGAAALTPWCGEPRTL